MLVGQISGETIKSAISVAIKEFFKITVGQTTTYPIIYKEQLEQDFIKPCFFIWTVDVIHKRIRQNVYEQDHLMNVRYHVDNPSTLYQELCQKGMDLLDCLNTINVPITLDGLTETTLPVKGIDVDYKILDGILQFYITYRIKVKRPLTEGPIMETLEINQL